MSSSETSRSAQADEALDELGRMSLRQYSMDSLLQAVAELSKKVMPGNPETSVFIQDRHQRVTVSSTGQLALALDEVQYSKNQGPCLHAASTGELTEVPDTRTETRWVDYMRRAAEHGNLSSLSVPLVIDDGVSGALNIYAREAHAFDDDARSAARRFAPYASVAVGNMFDYEAAKDVARNLEVALESRAVIDQAKGILMERYKVTADQAFQLLNEASNRTNTKLRVVADELVHTGELPKPRRG
ncbi:GAF and ANTAR domain-containing protein [Blastococcus saxobsidens]|uniref:GAF domain-containing protein n=1 Tax=Blastococcus saxobsidens TaxID=138336 RepID=A0A4Q7YAG8_9ACTN|nr:GAF and ANTAR domain-containing protein [Blastococcus saxobsidens]RZU33393.1 GAF domain-containing protein [Blastococcus saxobsidens]